MNHPHPKKSRIGARSTSPRSPMMEHNTPKKGNAIAIMATRTSGFFTGTPFILAQPNSEANTHRTRPTIVIVDMMPSLFGVKILFLFVKKSLSSSD
ncbi:MAG: hypothetical protein PHR36_02665 [Patescibacteria group bacterium]|nr:hypothetical protein [Patescibacteria group bacterium]